MGTLTGKILELIDLMKKRRMNILCAILSRRERKIGGIGEGFKLFNLRKCSSRNIEWIVVDGDLKQKICIGLEME